MKFDIGFFEFSNGTIEVINFQSDAASILAREHSLGETDRDRSCSGIVFEPVASLHFVIHGCVQAGNSFIKSTGAFHIGHGMRGIGNFLDFHFLDNWILACLSTGSSHVQDFPLSFP